LGSAMFGCSGVWVHWCLGAAVFRYDGRSGVWRPYALGGWAEVPPEACSNFGRRLVRIAPARAGQVPKIDERAVLLLGNRRSASVGSRAGGSVSAKSGPGLGDPPAPSVPRSARPCAGGAVFRADFAVFLDFWNSFVFIFRVPKRIFGVLHPGVFFAVRVGNGGGARGFLAECDA
jgi:hypothetical protein